MAEHPGSKNFSIDLCGGLVNFGNMKRSQGDMKEALGYYDQAIRVIGPVLPLARANTGSSTTVFARNAQWGRATVLEELMRYSDAREAWAAALSLAGPGIRTLFSVRHARTSALVGQHAAAGEEVDAVSKQPRQREPTPLQIASVYALCAAAAADDDDLSDADRRSMQEGYSKKAMALLQRGIETGFFQVRSRRDELLSHPDLASLRDRSDFKIFVEKVVGDIR